MSLSGQGMPVGQVMAMASVYHFVFDEVSLELYPLLLDSAPTIALTASASSLSMIVMVKSPDILFLAASRRKFSYAVHLGSFYLTPNF